MDAHTNPRSPGRGGPARPRWLPFSIVLAVLIALSTVPILLLVLAPVRAEGSVGVYERITLYLEGGEQSVVGGFIAPEGWLPDSDAEAAEAEEDDDEFPTEASYGSVSGDVRLSASLHRGVDGADALLRAEAPTGAVLAPIQTVEAGASEVRMLEYDLDAGAGFVQSFAMCSPMQPDACMLLEVDRLAASDAHGTIRPDISAVLNSAEVY